MTTHILTLDGPRTPICLLADALMDDERFGADASGAFDAGGPWRLEAYFSEAPDMPFLAARMGDALAPLGLDAVEIEQLLAGLALRPLDTADWRATGLDTLPPIVAGTFRVFGEHNRPPVLRRRDLVIAASTAFGSGDHASTFLTLCQMDHALRRRPFRRVLDVGTGTGILGLAALKARPDIRVMASDIDVHSVQVARLNRRQNDVGLRFRALHADGLGHAAFAAGGPYDLVLANILPDPLVRLSADIARLAAPGGMLIVAGLRLGEAARLVSAYAARGFTLRRRLAAKEWASLMFERTGRRPV